MESAWRKRVRENKKKSVGGERNGYVCERNGSIDGASEGYTNRQVFWKGKILHKSEGVGEN